MTRSKAGRQLEDANEEVNTVKHGEAERGAGLGLT